MVAITFPFISLLFFLIIEKKIGKVLMALWLIFLIVFLINTTQDIIETNNRIDELWKTLDN